MDLPRIPCRLQTHGISGQVTISNSFLYKLSVYDESFVEIGSILAFGLDKIAEPEDMLDQEVYETICSEFDVSAHEVVRPNKIELLLSNRSLQLLPDSVYKIENMGLS